MDTVKLLVKKGFALQESTSQVMTGENERYFLIESVLAKNNEKITHTIKAYSNYPSDGFLQPKSHPVNKGMETVTLLLEIGFDLVGLICPCGAVIEDSTTYICEFLNNQDETIEYSFKTTEPIGSELGNLLNEKA